MRIYLYEGNKDSKQFLGIVDRLEYIPRKGDVMSIIDKQNYIVTDVFCCISEESNKCYSFDTISVIIEKSSK